MKVGGRNRSIRAQLWGEVGKEGWEHLWSKQRFWRHKVLPPSFRGWRGKGRIGSSVLLIYTHARIPMLPLVSSATLLLVC